MKILTSEILLLCADEWTKATQGSWSALGKKAAFDDRFFFRIKENSGFSVEKYDSVMAWFDANWPKDADRPQCLNDWRDLQQWQAAHSYSNSAGNWPRVVVAGVDA